MNKKDELSKRILDYLNKKPGAGDTLEGITDWWLKSERVDQVVDEVAEVLEALIKKGLIIKSKYGVYKLSQK